MENQKIKVEVEEEAFRSNEKFNQWKIAVQERDYASFVIKKLNPSVKIIELRTFNVTVLVNM